MPDPAPPPPPAPDGPPPPAAPPVSRLLAVLRLVRAPIAFSAASNPLAACLAAIRPNESIPWGHLALLLPGSACLGLAGMALNDYFDRQRDAEKRPGRPIPARQVPAGLALALGLGLLAAGVTLAYAASRTSGLFAAIAAGFILLYDASLKEMGSAGAWTLGLARCANACAGLALAPAAARLLDASWAGRSEWVYPTMLLLFIQAVTQMSRLEDEPMPPNSRRMAIGIYSFLLMAGPWVVLEAKTGPFPRATPALACAALGLFNLLLAVRLVPAFRDPSIERIRSLVGTALTGLLLFDAAVVLSAGHIAEGAAVAAALPLAWLLGRRISIS